MDIDLTSQGQIGWEQAACPWNEAEQTTAHRCAVKNISLCPHFRGIEYLDSVLCAYPQPGGAFEYNSPLWRETEIDGPCLALLENSELDEVGGKVALYGDPAWRDIAVEVEMRFLRGRMPENPLRAWFGLALRAQDALNYELFWLMPQNSGRVGSVAHVPVAHGIVPWWSDGYANQAFGTAEIPADRWFKVRAEVRGRTARLYVNDHLALEKGLTYYIERGRVGLWAGTGTDAAFRSLTVQPLT